MWLPLMAALGLYALYRADEANSQIDNSLREAGESLDRCNRMLDKMIDDLKHTAYVLDAPRPGHSLGTAFITVYDGDSAWLKSGELPKDGWSQPDGSRVFSKWEDALAYREARSWYEVYLSGFSANPPATPENLRVYTYDGNAEVLPDPFPENGYSLPGTHKVVFKTKAQAEDYGQLLICAQLEKWELDGEVFFTDEEGLPENLAWITEYGYTVTPAMYGVRIIQKNER